MKKQRHECSLANTGYFSFFLCLINKNDLRCEEESRLNIWVTNFERQKYLFNLTELVMIRNR